MEIVTEILKNRFYGHTTGRVELQNSTVRENKKTTYIYMKSVIPVCIRSMYHTSHTTHTAYGWYTHLQRGTRTKLQVRLINTGVVTKSIVCVTMSCVIHYHTYLSELVYLITGDRTPGLTGYLTPGSLMRNLKYDR